MRPVWVLGLESSCDETAAAVVSTDGDVASDVVHSQVAIHAPYGGVVPEIASRDHLRAMGPVVREALARAGRSLAEIDAIAVTNRPGLIGALLVGVQLAKGLAWAAGKPLVGVDHLVGHLLAPFVRRPSDQNADALGAAAIPPAFPYVAALASGGHTAIYRVDGPLARDVRELGATRDDAAGEAFDKVAKLLGLGYPGGPVIDRLAQRGDPSRVRLVRPMAHRKGFEFSFSGLKTQIAQIVAKAPPRDEQEVADLCAAFQAVATTSLVEKLIAAARAEGVRDVVLTGGVAANRELRARAAEAARDNDLRLTVPPFASCTDNAAMIAYAGAQRFAAGERDALDLGASSVGVLPRRTLRGAGPRSAP
ncbi:MAG: tRNA (adenosine(37)-N6)-threonylcarbamoyltransferase complex transferase subunit TsaD [Deltaproteobacteria bacterium]|nr:tRNA (adenosine(37)-N6)-threonylcarbamoyltransferase complex transferase subunit TsaD [Deltaproteobacteria bacterium]